MNFSNQQGKKVLVIGSLTVFFAVLVGVYFLFQSTPKATHTKSMSMASKLASIDAKNALNDNDRSTVRIQAALDSAVKVCNLTLDAEREIADLVSRAWGVLKGEGKETTNIELLEMLPQVAIYQKSENDCKKLVAMYLTIRHDGQNHLAATNGLRGMIEDIQKITPEQLAKLKLLLK